MPPKTKRPYNKSRRKTYAKYGGKQVAAPAAKTIQAAIRRALAQNIETKKSNYSNTDYIQIAHNSAVNIDNELLRTTQGVADPEGNQNTLNRIGDQITLKGVAIRMMIELNNRYSDVTYRILVVKSSKGDTPTNATLFNGVSGNRMLDTLNRERYTICFEKWGKITSRNMNMGTGGTVVATGAGNYYATDNAQGNYQSRATKIIKFWLPYSKLQRSPNVIYENNLGQVKQTDYNVLIYAYSNYDTSELLGFNVLAVNDYVKVMYYKDA